MWSHLPGLLGSQEALFGVKMAPGNRNPLLVPALSQQSLSSGRPGARLMVERREGEAVSVEVRRGLLGPSPGRGAGRRVQERGRQ